ncbi:DUF4058 domain-containing protein [Gemmata sp. JC717]|uniref:DUF4058 domain-containing protein n=1 Tax=Gemmata algarum TaxID=2975278 RepID=UPI0021BADF3A|nr:DUF4058 domain-containing protein [Gemmata algarum]MDY3552773.1 DUF4058 domain-containing protein [Gemmata algarum]
MPLHDWTRVDTGIFHDFHLAWIAEIRRELNGGLLPSGYYALAEQVAGGGNPDVLTLHEPNGNGHTSDQFPTEGGGTARLTAPPQTRLVAKSEHEFYTAKQRRMVIRHTSGDRIVAMVEIVSAGNKASEYAWQTATAHALAALRQGVHLLVLDAHPPTPRDPNGFHGSLWEQLDGTAYVHPGDADRTLAAYSAGPVKTAYVEPVAVGHVLRNMPLFLTPDGTGSIEVPLEPTYRRAFEGVPRRYRAVLEAA